MSDRVSRLGRARRLKPSRKRTYARIYGRFENESGQRRGFEFQVRISHSLSRKAQYKLITHTVNKMKYEKLIPVHKRRQTFSSFAELFKSQWIHIRKICDYDVAMDYPTPFD